MPTTTSYPTFAPTFPPLSTERAACDGDEKLGNVYGLITDGAFVYRGAAVCRWVIEPQSEHVIDSPAMAI